MNYYITEACTGGYSIESQPEHYEDRKLEAVAKTREEIGDYFRSANGYTVSRPSVDEAAEAIGDCFDRYQEISNKIYFIKAIRLASGAGLKEAKDAAERVIAKRALNMAPRD